MSKKRRRNRFSGGARLKLRISERAMAAAEVAFRRSRYFVAGSAERDGKK